MTDEEILQKINSLPPEAVRQLEDFISFLGERYGNSESKTTSTVDLESEAFVGMWRDREDLIDSSAWVRTVRESHWRG